MGFINTLKKIILAKICMENLGYFSQIGYFYVIHGFKNNIYRARNNKKLLFMALHTKFLFLTHCFYYFL